MGKGGKLRTNIEYWAARALLGGLGRLSRPAAVIAGRSLGRVGYTICGKLRRTGLRNLELAYPAMSARGRQRILRGCFDSLGRQLGEFSQFPRTSAEGLRDILEYEYDAADMERILAAKRCGQGIIFITSHLGAWELLVFAHSAFDDPLSFLVRPIDNPRIDRMIEQVRTRFGSLPIDKKAGVLTALRVLRKGGTLGILADLNTQPHEGVFVPFFGHLACTTAGVAALALRTNALVVPVCAPWDNRRQRFIARGGPVLEVVRTGDYQHDIEINTARFAAAIEDHIRAYPEQWLWIHRRWKTRPPGEPSLYEEHSLPRPPHKLHHNQERVSNS